jgi:hypothetical protein
MIRLTAVAGLLFVGMCACLAQFAQADDPMPKPAPDAQAPPKEIDVAKTTERIVNDAKEAGKRLAAKDPGDQTQRIQKEIIANIDSLIRKAQEPPPPMNSDNSSSTSSGMKKSDGNAKQPMDGGSSSAAAERKQRREQKNGQANGGSRTQPASSGQRPDPMKVFGGASSATNKIEPKGALPRLPDVYKDVWGHLPEKMRQEMDLYFREQFMPRYSDLLRQYYSSLAERGGKSNP